MTRARRHMLRCCAMLVLGVVVVTAPTDSVAQQTRPTSTRVNGRYDPLIFAGHFTGRGGATVNPKMVIITARVSDDAGASGNFQARCTRNGNLFSGTGSAPSGGTITVQGRLDPPSKALPKPRLSFTYIASTGKTGRAAGVLVGGP